MHIPRVPILNAWILRATYELERRIVIILSFHVSINEPSSTHLVALNAPNEKGPGGGCLFGSVLRVVASFTVVVLLSLPVCVELFQTLFLEFLK
jgi:hypothetical protein